MKKQLLILIFLILVFRAGSYAQDIFAPVGAEWYYAGNEGNYNPWALDGDRWVDRVRSVKDTVVAGRACRKLQITRSDSKTNHPEDEYTRTSEAYVYDNTDTVFVFEPGFGRFIPLYIFNAHAGDTICLPVIHPQAPGGTFCFVVDSVVTELYDTAHLRSFYTRALHPGGPAAAINWGQFDSRGYNAGRYTERIGGNWGLTIGLFPTATYKNPDIPKEIGFPSGTFRCYSDAGYSIHMDNMDYCGYTPPLLDIQGVSRAGQLCSLFPNPCRGLLQVQINRGLTEQLTMTISDLSGKMLQTRTFSGQARNEQLDLGSYPPGIYLCRISSGGNSFYQKIVIGR